MTRFGMTKKGYVPPCGIFSVAFPGVLCVFFVTCSLGVLKDGLRSPGQCVAISQVVARRPQAVPRSGTKSQAPEIKVGFPQPN